MITACAECWYSLTGFTESYSKKTMMVTIKILYKQLVATGGLSILFAFNNITRIHVIDSLLLQ